MRFLIHGFKSLVRRPAKTGMLFVILFVVFNLIFSGFIIQNSIARSKEYIRNQIGSAVEYRIDVASLFSGTQNGRPGQTTIPALSIQVAEKMASNPYVKSYYISEAANVDSTTIDPATTQATGGDFQRNFSDFTLSGSNRTDILDFVLGNVTLSSGRSLTADDLKNGTRVVIISENVASTNSLRVGDTIQLAQTRQQIPNGGTNQQPGGNTGATTGTTLDYEVIGIYKAVKDSYDVNTMFTSNTVIYDLNGTTASDETTGSIVFLLDNPEHVNAFIEQSTPLLTSKYHTLYSDDSEYTSLTKPLNLLSFITSILIWVVFMAGAAIIMALVTIFVRDRKFEIGLLLSSGEGRLKVVSQFVLEMLVIAVVAFGISFVSSLIISKGVSTWIVDNQLLSSTSLIGSTSTSTTGIGQMFGRFGQSSTSLYGAVNMQSVADKFNVAVTAPVVGQLLLASFILILLGSSIPLLTIMRYKPRRIMQDDN